MSKIDLNLIQQLRDKTGVGMMDCKKALIEANGNIEEAIVILRKKGAAVAEKRSGNVTAQGLVHAYIHPGAQVGVLVEINCETDFVARTPDLVQFAQDVCMHIAAYRPKYLSPADVDQAFLDKERTLFREQMQGTKKPENILEQIIEGKIQKLYSEICLLQQPFIKNDSLTVDGMLKELIGKMGESIKIKRFARFEIGAE